MPYVVDDNGERITLGGGRRKGPQKLASIKASSLTDSGLFRSTHPLDAPLWRDGRNVIFRDGGPGKIQGWQSVLTVSGAGVIRGCDALQDEAAVQRLFFGDAAKLWTWNGATVTQIGSGFTGQVDETVTADATAWSFARFGNWMLATNGRDPVQIWKSGSSVSALAGSPPKAEIVLRRGPHILLFNTSGVTNGSGATWVHWSVDDNPEIWTPSSTNSAGDLNLRDMDGPIVAAVPLGDAIAVLGKNQLAIVRYSGSPFYFSYQPALTGIGAVGKMAVVEANRILYGMSRTGFWKTDGVTYEYLDTLALRDWWGGVVDTTQLSKVVATYDAQNEQVIWFLPTSGTKENTLALAYRIPNGAWTIYDFGRSAAVPQLGVYKQPAMFGTDDKLYFHNEGHDANAGVALPAWVQTKPMDFGDQRAQKYLHELSLQLRRLTGTARVRIGTQQALDDAVTWGAYIPVDDGFEKIDLRTSGRFVTLEISSDTAGADWAVTGFDIYGTSGGRP